MATDGKTITLDFETYSESNVRLVGAHKYSRHPSTEVMILCYKINNGPIRTWLPHKRATPPVDLLTAAADEEFEFHAHNAEFESCIWREVMVRAHHAPPIALRRWRCTALKAAACGLPRSLEMAGRAAQLSQQKDIEGSRLIQKFCKPRKASKNNPSTRWTPADAPEEFASFVNYCQMDVATEHELDSVLLEYPEPWEVYTQNLEMNYRGLPLDMPNVRKGLKIAAELDRRIVARVVEITGGIKPTQRDKILAYMQTELGLAIENTQAKTLTDLMTLHGDEMPAATREFLQLRIEGGKASPRKLKKMLEVACDDGRVRGCFLPFGGHTGRESGKLIQPQNFKRGTYDASMMEFVHSLIDTGDADYFELLFHYPVEALAEAMRGFIKTGKGRKMVVCDFAAIEARVLAWLAGDKKKTEAYRTGADLYKRMAVKLYNLPNEDAVETWQRKFAKDLILGCFGADTLVLTEAGWKRIPDVTRDDRVWDGVEWVGCDGAIYQGKQGVIELCEVQVTPNHLVLCDQQWHPASSVTRSVLLKQSALNSATLPFSTTWSAPVARADTTNASAGAGKSFTLPRTMSMAGSLGLAMTARKAKRLGHLSSASPSGSTLTPLSARLLARTEYSNALTRFLLDGSGGAALAGLSLPRQHGSGTAPQKPASASSVYTAGAARLSKALKCIICTPAGRTCTSAVDRTATLAARVSKFASGGMTLRSLPQTASGSQDTSPARTNWNSIGGTTTATTNPRTADSSRNSSTCETVDTYDVLNAGPRNRFTILTSEGPVIVHNCGFQLGGPGFAKNCLARGIAITDEAAQAGVDTYRDDSPEIVGFWKLINDACVSAVRDGVARINAVKCKLLRVYTRRTSGYHHWLCVRLPSGRELRYFRPEVKMVDKWGNGKLQAQLSYLGEFKGKPAREATYGGKLTENVVQAIARDIMIVSSFEAEKDGYPCIGRVHDELITEVDGDFGSKHELEDILKRRRKWYDTAPIGAEGFEGIRYRKA